MGIFKKKHDPISEKERALNDQIAALEAEIKKLAAGPAADKISAAVNGTGSVGPRLRSTAHPQGPPGTPAHPTPPRAADPVFEAVEHNRLEAIDEKTTASHYNDLGVRKYDLAAAWHRFKNHFRGPTTSNPKLVNYLAAGSIQGLRPLRYEKRVARNRFLLLVGILVLVLWGIIYVFFFRR